jgi:hypothetical protein
VVVSLEQGDGGENHPRRAVSALKGFGLKESLLYGMKVFAARESFNSRDFFPHRGASRSYATPHRCTIEQNGASPALAFAAPVLGSRQFKPVAQYVQQRFTGRRVNFMFTSIYRKSESHELTSRKCSATWSN